LSEKRGAGLVKERPGVVVNTTSELGERKRLVNGGHFLKCPLFFWKMAVLGI